MEILSSTPVSTYMSDGCPDCLRSTRPEDKPGECRCGYAFPCTFVIPYDYPWEYSESVFGKLRSHEGARLLGKLKGGRRDLLYTLVHLRYLYVSRYPGFRVEAVENFSKLEFLEIDFIPIETLDAIERIPNLACLQLTECRRLSDVSAIAAVPKLQLLRIALCNRVRDLEPVGSVTSLRRFDIEARQLSSLRFLESLHRLEVLNLAVDRVVEEDSLSVLQDMPHLQKLGIRRRLAKRVERSATTELRPNYAVELFP